MILFPVSEEWGIARFDSEAACRPPTGEYQSPYKVVSTGQNILKFGTHTLVVIVPRVD